VLIKNSSSARARFQFREPLARVDTGILRHGSEFGAFAGPILLGEFKPCAFSCGRESFQFGLQTAFYF
jgi:hypothetical protein